MMKKTAGRLIRTLSQTPGRALIFGYFAFILAGAFALMLPQSTFKGEISFVDALFTSASAVCVTGLTVVDTAGTYTDLGRWIILILIQVGGLGIMVFSTFFLLSLGKKMGFGGRMLIRDTYSIDENNGGGISLLRDIIVFTLSIELVGAGFLFSRFIHTQTLPVALMNAVFNAVSAFCNAGFSLFSNSFVSYRGDIVVNLTICFLIILGGIGFIVLSEIKEKMSLSKRSWARFSLHSKLVLSTTGILLVVSTLCFILFEWNNEIAKLPMVEKCLAGFFQSVNTRTAGFNSLDISRLSNGTLFMMIILMFIGAAPGSCGGGIKVTTFSAMVLLGWSRLKGQDFPHVFYRRISDAGIAKAVSLILVSILVVIVGTLLLLETEIGEASHQLTRGAFLELMFETVSAFGTVGLSTGVTPSLTVAGKIIISCIMFIGRLGPLGVAMAVSKNTSGSRYTYATENIMIG